MCMHNQSENIHFPEQMQMKKSNQTEWLCISYFSYFFCKLGDERDCYAVSVLSTWDMHGKQV